MLVGVRGAIPALGVGVHALLVGMLWTIIRGHTSTKSMRVKLEERERACVQYWLLEILVALSVWLGRPLHSRAWSRSK
jgi:hypothetical protein